LAVRTPGDRINRCGMPSKRLQFFSRFRIPKSNGSIIAGGRDLTPLRIPFRPTDDASVTKEHQRFHICFNSIPYTNGMILAGGCQAPAVWTPSNAFNPSGMPVERKPLLAGGCIPNLHDSVCASRGQ